MPDVGNTVHGWSCGVISTLKQKVIILLARLFPLKRVCMESASSTSLENMFHSSW